MALRAYAVPAGLLVGGAKANVLAVRTKTIGGAGQGAADGDGSFPGGLFDDPVAPISEARVGPFDPAAALGKSLVPGEEMKLGGSTSTGYTLGGVGWYRKTFSLAPLNGRRVFIKFDGVYMNASTWVNGVLLGTHPYGYTTFEYDVTDHVAKGGGANVVAVMVNNNGWNSRWYSGSGIYRHTHLRIVDPVHVPLWGLHATSPSITFARPGHATRAVVAVEVTVANTLQTDATATVTVVIGSVNGAFRSPPQSTRVHLPANTTGNATVSFDLAGAAQLFLWSPESPALYTVNATATVAAADVGGTTGGGEQGGEPRRVIMQGQEHMQGGEQGQGGEQRWARVHAEGRKQGQGPTTGAVSTDSTWTTFGVRSVSVSATTGLLLNGVPTKLYGGCVHHANGPLGARAIDRAEERKVEILKGLGYNAVRTSHNPASSAFLDACDRLGVLVMEETFDCWSVAKHNQDYHLYFKDWWRRDTAMMVMRDRSRPSVIMWSIGNEIPNRWTDAVAAVAVELRDYVHSLDPGSGRAVTSAYPMVAEQDSKFLHELDVAGYNYAVVPSATSPGVYALDHGRVPNRTMVGTESWGTDSYAMWSQVWTMPWVIGDFVWAAMDYLGETGLGSATETGDVDEMTRKHPFPWHISNCGDVDIVGHQKPQSLYRTVLWGAAPITMAVHTPGTHPEQVSSWGWPEELPSWTFPGHDGRDLQVRVFARGCETAVLFLNGKRVASAPFQANFTAVANVTYAPGKLEARCFNGTTAVAGRAAALVTAGVPSALTATPDRAAIRAAASDLSFVTIAVVDAAGAVVDTDTGVNATTVSVTVRGPGKLLALGNGNPADPASFYCGQRAAWRGRLVAIVKPTAAAGHITLTASAPGLPNATAVITTAKP